MGDLQDLVGRFYDAFTRGDLDAAEACFDPYVTVVSPGVGEMRGVAAWRAHAETFKRAAPDAELRLRSAVEASDRIAVEGTFAGTFTGPLQTPRARRRPPARRSPSTTSTCSRSPTTASPRTTSTTTRSSSSASSG